MANKRIELEQYRSYVNLIDEEPNRKMVKRGVTIALFVTILLAVLFLILGFFSNERAKKPGNVLEKPEVPSKKTQTPAAPEPPKSLLTPRKRLYACARLSSDVLSDVPISLGAGPDSMLTADIKSGSSVIVHSAQIEGKKASAETKPVEKNEKTKKKSPEKKQKKSLPLQTKGVGNLSNLAKAVNERGFQLYMLALAIAFGVLGTVAITRARRERKGS